MKIYTRVINHYAHHFRGARFRRRKLYSLYYYRLVYTYCTCTKVISSSPFSPFLYLDESICMYYSGTARRLFGEVYIYKILIDLNPIFVRLFHEIGVPHAKTDVILQRCYSWTQTIIYVAYKYVLGHTSVKHNIVYSIYLI